MTDERPTGSPPKPPSPAERQAAAQETTAAALETLSGLFARRDQMEALEREEARREERRRAGLRIGHRSEPRRMDILTFARALPPLAEMFSRKIPSGAWAVDRDQASILCPCKPEGDLIAQKGVPTSCPGACGRVYVFDDENVRVGYPENFQPSRHLEPVPTQGGSNAQTSVES